MGERSNVSDSLAKKENIAASLQSEKQKLHEDLQKVSRFAVRGEGKH